MLQPSPTQQAGRLRYWLPPLAWMGLIFYFSTDTFSGQNTGSIIESILGFLNLRLDPRLLARIHFLIRKAGHFAEYGVLAALLFRAFRGASPDLWRREWFIRTLAVTAAWALLDEAHQTFTRSRYGSIIDCAIDVAGGLAVLGMIRLYVRMK
ncbi:MAG: VanZ family protein [Acidobacteriota bacterium]|nr:MAG: VanZ family protein [Acidobacteriota bacterium]